MPRRKIQSFADYDAAKAEREDANGMIERGKARLEAIVERDIKKKQLVVENSVEVVDIGPRQALVVKIVLDRIKYVRRASDEIHTENRRDNLADLVRCGYNLADSARVLSPDDKSSLYTRFIQELRELIDSLYDPQFKVQVPAAIELSRKLQVPEFEEHRAQFKLVLRELKKRKYLTARTEKSLIELVTKEPVEKTEPGVRRVTNLVAKKKAEPEEEKIVPKPLDCRGELSRLVGEDYASQLMALNPGILDYRSKYFNTIERILQGIAGYAGEKRELEERFGPNEDNLERYSSLAGVLGLKRELFEKTGDYDGPEDDEEEEPTTIDYQIVFSGYAILKRIPVMERRLSSLIENGELVVGKQEHWMGEKVKGGLRGRNILKAVRTQINDLLSELGYEPSCRINFGQHKVTISDESRVALQEIRVKRNEIYQRE